MSKLASRGAASVSAVGMVTPEIRVCGIIMESDIPRLSANCASLVMASHSSKMTSLNLLLHIDRTISLPDEGLDSFIPCKGGQSKAALISGEQMGEGSAEHT